MSAIRNLAAGLATSAALALAPAAGANAHGFAPIHPFGAVRGIAGAVAGLVTLPLVIASSVIAAGAPAAPPSYPAPAPAYYPPGYAYAPPQPYGYYAPRAYYGARAGGYAGRGYAAPRYVYGGHPRR
jgi:hypothetical protein